MHTEKKIVYVVYDDAHNERIGKFPSLVTAMDEVLRISKIPWGQKPNIPPTQNLTSHERRYEVIVFDTSKEPWKIMSKTPFLKMNAKGVFWEEAATDA